MGDAESFAGCHFRKAAIQFAAWSKAHRVDNSIQPVPLIAQRREYCLDLFVTDDIAGVA